MNDIYLDNNATTRPLPEVVEAVTWALSEGFGNPSSIHGKGEMVRHRLNHAREQVAHLLNARPTEVVFTSCATESLNAAIRGAVAVAPADRRHLIITAVEHEATIEIGQHLRKKGVELTVLPVDRKGHLDFDALKKALEKNAALLSIMLSNNETGVVFPVARIAEMARSAGVPTHVDAVQAVGKIPLDVVALGVDFLSLSGHKFHAPKGVGVLYVRRGARVRPFLVGASQEGGRRGGTENVPGVLGLGAAAELMGRDIEARRRHLSELGARLEERLLRISATRLNGDPNGRVPGTVNVSFAGIEGSAVVLTAAREGVCLSAGSACSAAQYGGSHVLEAMGTPFEYLHGAVRFSCAETTTLSEVDTALEVVERAVAYLRAMIPGAQASTGS